VCVNNYIQSQGLGRLEYETNMYHLKQDFTMHPLVTSQQIMSTAEPIRNRRYTIPRTNSINTSINNNINTSNITFRDINNYGAYTVGYYENSYIDDYPPNSYTPFQEPTQEQISELVNRKIPEQKKTCGISLDEINENEKYMRCHNCTNNFKELEIKTWLETRRNCPTCRMYWLDFNVYVNIDLVV
jgi:hypothetical protein